MVALPPRRMRFIPVHTGNTKSTQALAKVLAVYPRAYGEHHSGHLDQHPLRGLSPCIRGTRVTHRRSTPRMRFIPVHTGNTCTADIQPHLEPVYPRAYGEHQGRNCPEDVRRGLSPCIRGTPSLWHRDWISLRFIPVHTGNTCASGKRLKNMAVYPRAYGEHYCAQFNKPRISGLSPCIRGTQLALGFVL